MKNFSKIRFMAMAAAFLFAAAAALAQTTPPDATGLSATAGAAGLSTAEVSIGARVGTIIKVLLGLIGVVFMVLMVYAGALWMTAQGTEEKITKAKSIITGAVIGLIIIFAAYSITDFVVTRVLPATGA